jgi:hypothetical protein
MLRRQELVRGGRMQLVAAGPARPSRARRASSFGGRAASSSPPPPRQQRRGEGGHDGKADNGETRVGQASCDRRPARGRRAAEGEGDREASDRLRPLRGPEGKTPEATISAVLAVGSKPGGPFKRVDKGTYGLAQMTTATSTPAVQAEPATANKRTQARKPAQAQEARRPAAEPSATVVDNDRPSLHFFRLPDPARSHPSSPLGVPVICHPLACIRQRRPIDRSSNGYTSAYRNGLIAAMYALPNRPFGFTSTAICAW